MSNSIVNLHNASFQDAVYQTQIGINCVNALLSTSPYLYIYNYPKPMHYHLSQLSSSFFDPGPPFFTEEVPIALGREFPASAKLSQKSFLLSSMGTLLLPSLPSTKRLNPSAAPFAPAWAPFATCAAVIRAWAAKSVSASWIQNG